MAQFYYGLNVNFSFSEIVDEDAALSNLGLKKADLDLISGIFDEGVTTGDIITLSGADFDIKKQYDSVAVALEKYVTLMGDIKVVSEVIDSNIVVDDQFRARSIKFDYYDFYNGTLRAADISTSRISSWSSFDEFDPFAPIFYKGDLEVTPNPVAGSISTLDITSLTTTVQPTPKRFKAEVPTHLVSINVNGSVEKFLAMKGIPLKFNATAQTLTSGTSGNVDHRVLNGAGDPPPTWTITNLGPTNSPNDDQFFPYEDVRNTGGFGQTFFANGTSPLLLEFYNDPRKIDLLRLRNMRLSSFTNSQISGLTELYIDSNELAELPNLRYTAPILEKLDASSNPFYRSNLTAAQQLSKLPATIQWLTLNNCFSDSSNINLAQNIDGENLTALERFTFYGNNSTTRMKAGGPTPSIYVDPTTDQNTSMERYDIRYQDYEYLDESVMKARNLTHLYLYSNSNNPISAGWNGTQEIDITLDSVGDGGLYTGSLQVFQSERNSHNVVNVSSCQSITTYNMQNSPSIRGSSSIVGAFNGCGKLSSISLSSSPVTGNIALAFKNLPSLSSLNLSSTAVSGYLEAATFQGTNNLTSFTVSSSSLGGPNAFFDQSVFANTSKIGTINVYGNKNMNGSLPNFNANKSLSWLTITGTSINSGLTNLAEMPNLYWFNISSNEFTGGLPTFNNARLRYLYLSGNKFNGSFPTPNTPNLYSLQASGSSTRNRMTGSIPNFSGCPRLRNVYLDNNRFTSYSSGSISSCLNLRYFYVNGNLLTVADGARILRDAYQIHANNITSTVRRVFNISGNGFTLNDLLTYEPDMQNMYDTLTLIRRWSFVV